MSVSEWLALLQDVVNHGGAGYLVVLEDEDDEIYTFTDTMVDSEHEVMVLQVDTRPMELR